MCRIETDLPHLLSEKLPELSLDESLFVLHDVTMKRSEDSLATAQADKVTIPTLDHCVKASDQLGQ